jgi:uncharacterized protein YecT (DUF1311 family)
MARSLMVLLFVGVSMLAPQAGQARTKGQLECRNLRTTVEGLACWAKRKDAAEARLNVLESRLDAIFAKQRDYLGTFEAAQARWKQFVTDTCDEVVGKFWAGGSFQGPAKLECLARQTEQRTDFLESTFELPLRQLR